MSWAGRRLGLTGRELPRRSRPYRVLVLGGARSGKSVTAERLLARRDQVDYVATGALPDPGDPEWAARVRLHQQRRPARWATLETRDLESVLAAPDLTPQRLATPVLVDCLSTWLAGVMDECGLWSAAPGAEKALAGRVDGLLDAWGATRRTVELRGLPPFRKERGRMGHPHSRVIKGAPPAKPRATGLRCIYRLRTASSSCSKTP